MKKSPIGLARRSRLLGNAALLTLATLGATASCGQTKDPAAGLMLAIQSDGPLPINRLEIRIASKGKELRRTSYRVPEEATLPTTLAIASNGNARASVEIVVVGWHDEVPLDRRDAIVTQVPADRVALLRVVLSGRCSSRVKVVDDEAVSTCREGETCSPSTGDCTPADVDAQQLDTYQGGDELGSGGGGGGGGADDDGQGGAGGVPELGDGGTGGTLLPSGGTSPGTSGDGGHGGDGIPKGPDPVLIGCGDGVIQLDDGEVCDDGNLVPGDGCAADCRAIDRGYSCLQSGACQLAVVCGDGKLGGLETCDDGNDKADDGCSATCTREAGFRCYVPGEACAPRCGDGKVRAPETCDDGGTSPGDGCNASCLVEPGYTCTEQAGCVKSVCPDGHIDANESCDDNNSAAGDSCSAVCTLEPQVTLGANPSVAELCGDGMATASEGCDDGNITGGDGCSATCKVEDGWACASAQTALPPTLTVPVTFRDFKSASAVGGHPDFQYKALGAVNGIAGAPCTVANQATCGRLNALGKPSLTVNNQATTGILNASTFGLWFTDGNPSSVPGYNGVIATTTSFKQPMTLTQLGGASANVYQTAAGSLFPLDGQGFGPISGEVSACAGGVFNYGNTCTACIAPCPTHNFGFTSELRHFFQYQGGETLSFLGDDDVWVFVNGRLAVDIGGMHEARYGQVVLGDDGAGVVAEDSNCSRHNSTTSPPNPGTAEVPGCYTTAERAKTTDDRFGLTVGGVYEIVLFQAERHTSASNFQLTLGGFIEPRSVCVPSCGDGVRTSTEACDGGKTNSNTDYLACNTTCTARAVCGDGIQHAAEDCDNGVNDTVYFVGKPSAECSPGCTTPPYCGDGIIDSLFGEQCDDGANDNSYAGCSRTCKLVARCGDGIKQQTHETCDDGNRLSGDGCSAGCQRE